MSDQFVNNNIAYGGLWDRMAKAHFFYNIDAEYRTVPISKGETMLTSEKQKPANRRCPIDQAIRPLHQLQHAQTSNSPSILISKLKKDQNKPISDANL